ncbi:MAG TPA: dihydrofolate reductase family protein [Chitinophagaceae bacterium]|nr:dihydrofolate reductase family protein [Chitinophagaceae bacterium]
MRKLILSMNLSLDGCMASADQQLDWHLRCWTSEMGDELCRQLATADTILLGRKTFSVMAAYWPMQNGVSHCRAEDFAYAQMMNSYQKIVFSRTLRIPAWHNALLYRDSPATVVQQLKQRPGKNMIVYGSCQLAETLVQAGLVDEYQLWIHPIVLGGGKKLFTQLPYTSALQLLGTRQFSTGVVTLYYAPGPAHMFH